ncbi:hypothetical protein BT96DRAFT_921656 [Gymnopus androsaceus JB14]|uniref:Uncharacterized protein n=1 Tax=Gymnopus androsaceus JB14 TaxID=1447944 RepID=A0A6A4HIA6_9AGAR|nr:hypothetical protein BT96DRAFT_921656 [Gymnopus androsaceus JB14]
MTSRPKSRFASITKSFRGSLRKSTLSSLTAQSDAASTPTSDPAPSHSPPSFVVFGVLGIAGPLKERNVGFMMTDFVVWISFFWQLAGLDRLRSKFNSIRPIIERFPDKKVIFGQAACQRLQLPLPPCLDQTDYSTLSQSQFTTHCKVELQRTADAMKPGETLVVLLIGHGGAGSSEDPFRFYITTTFKRSSPNWITKYDLECAVQQCKAEIVVICNSCKSGALESPLWTLLCAAGSTQHSDSLMPSQLDYVRDSVFTLCTLAQAGQEQGLMFPLPRSEPRPPGTLHSFSTSSSSRNSWSHSKQRFLVMESTTQGIAWHCILPAIFTESFIHQIEVYRLDPESSLNGAFYPTQGGVSAETLVEEQKLPSDILLSLTEAFIKAGLCLDFLNNVDRSTDVAQDLMYDLYTRHVQAVVVQELARLLGWWVVGDIAPFFSAMKEGRNAHHQSAMIESGIPVDMMVLRLPSLYPGIFTVTDRASSYWLAGKWADAGSPAVSLEDWNDAVDEAAKSAICQTLVTDYDECRRLLPAA